MRAILDRVIVKRKPQTQAGRFVLATTEPSQLGTVIAVGPGSLTKDGRRIPTGINVGDVVYFEAGQELIEQGETYVVLLPMNVIGIADPEQSQAAKEFQDSIGKLVEPNPFAGIGDRLKVA